MLEVKRKGEGKGGGGNLGGGLQHRLLKAGVDEGFARLLAPALSRELRKELTDGAAQHAARVFAANLRALLLRRPVRGGSVLGLDPGVRTGTKYIRSLLAIY